MYQEDLAKNIQLRYTYDELSRVTERIETNVLTGATLSTETFTYDAAGNVTEDGENTTFVYDTNNRLTQWENNTLCYDANGNLLNGYLDGVGATFGYDSANRLLTVRNHTYTYNAEDVRIKAVRGTQTTVYTYDTSEELSRLLMKSVGNTVTKYVYGDGLIGEETDDTFTTYHFDYRGSTVALTDEEGAITDTFEYDTYGKLTGHTGSFDTLFLYNGQYGVMTENIGLCYMRARYY
ncbi:MAG: wall-associated protein, partial [Clostridia bacterium]|nr:wall-associated protein [Clostridia bacterium]